MGVDAVGQVKDYEAEHGSDGYAVGEVVDLLLRPAKAAQRRRRLEALEQENRRRAERAQNQQDRRLLPSQVPSWWWSESELLIRRFSGLQDEILELFGLREGERRRFLRVVEISDFVEQVARHEKPIGEPSLLWVPLRRGEYDLMYFRRKVVYDGFDRWIDCYEREYSPTPGELARRQRLSRLAAAARLVAKTTGCLKEEATAFLLANDTPIFLPYEAGIDEYSGGIAMHFRDRRISGRDVTKIFSELAGRAFDGAGLAHKRRRAEPAEMFEFVEYWRGDGEPRDWDECYKAYLQGREGKAPYDNVHEFQQAYDTERDRRKRVRRAAEALGPPRARIPRAPW